MKKIMLTGARPTGKLHLGHYVGAFKNFAQFQNRYENYFIISDLHMLTTETRKKEVLAIHENAINMFMDCVGMGIDPGKTTFYLQSNIPELTFFFVLIQNLITVKRVKKTPSLLEMSKHANMDGLSLGLLAYPVLEAGDIISLEADYIPVGRDNIDHIKITQEIVQQINKKYNSNFKIPNYVTSNNNHIVGLDGHNKMSKSLNNAIFIRDTKQDIENKINNITWQNSLDVKNKNVVIEYLKIFGKDTNIFNQIVEDYNKGKNIEKHTKKILIKILNDLLDPMRERISRYENNQKMVDDILKSGTEVVRKKVIKTLDKLKKAMGLFSYW